MNDLFGCRRTSVEVEHGENRVNVTGNVRIRAEEGGAEFFGEDGTPLFALDHHAINSVQVPKSAYMDRRQHSLAAAFLLGRMTGAVVHGPVPRYVPEFHL